MSGKGIVFGIGRTALNDGPGIRTVVFLKGCPLKCIWCHNPESHSADSQLMFQSERCVGCMSCSGVCGADVHTFTNGVHFVNFESCRLCGACIDECAAEALKISGRAMSVDEVMRKVCADIVYYKNSGGGLTVSGGEPLTQFEFLKELLCRSRSLGIRTCIETCGFAPTDNYEALLGLVDIFLFDIKHTDDTLHKKYTGVSNELIFKNFEFLYGRGAKIILRSPIIPGINDSDKHIDAIARIVKNHPNLAGTEALPYHDMGKGKWRQLGKQYPLYGLKSASEEEKLNIAKRFRSAGCNCTVL